MRTSPKYFEIDKTLEKIGEELFNRIALLAIKVLRADDNVDNFCMGMGSASFGTVDGGNPDPEELPTKGATARYVKEITRILDNYNDMFKLTGCPVKIDKLPDGAITVVFDWGSPGTGRMRRTARNKIPFHIVPPGESIHAYSDTIDALFEEARDTADANGTGYPEEVAKVIASNRYQVFDHDRDMVVEMLNIQ